MPPSRKPWGQEQLSGGAQWGANVTLRALQSESVPFAPSAFHRHISQTNGQGALSPPRGTASSAGRGSFSASSGSGRIGSFSGASSTDGPASTSRSATTQRGPSAPVRLGQHSHSASTTHLPSQQHPSISRQNSSQQVLRTQSALGVYRTSECISPTTSTFAVEQTGLPSKLDTSLPYWQGGDSPALLRGLEIPFEDPEAAGREPASPTQLSRASRGTQGIAYATPYGSWQQGEVHQDQHTPRVASAPLDALEQIDRQAQLLTQARQQAAAAAAAAVTNASLRPHRTAHFTSTASDCSNVGTTGDRNSGSSGEGGPSRPIFMEEYDLDWDQDNSGQGGVGGWDADSDDEPSVGKRSHKKSNSSPRKVTISDDVTAHPDASPRSSTGKTSLFRKAFKASANKRDRSSAAKRLSIPRKPVPTASPRSILRHRASSIYAASPRQSTPPLGLFSPSISSPIMPVSTFSPDSVDSQIHPVVSSDASAAAPVTTSAPVDGQGVTEDAAESQRVRHRKAPLPPPPSRKPSVPESVQSFLTHASQPILSANASPDSIASLPASSGMSSSPTTSSLSARSSRQSLSTDGTSSVNSAQLMTIRKVAVAAAADSNAATALRRASAAESTSSLYDQESWDGHASHDIGSEGLASPATALATLNSVLKTKRSVLLAEKSPLLSEKIMEMDDESSSAGYATTANSSPVLDDDEDDDDDDADDTISAVVTPNKAVALDAQVIADDEADRATEADDEDDESDADLFQDAREEARRQSALLDAATFADAMSAAALPAPPRSPTKYKIVRSNPDDSQGTETLDSIHVYPSDTSVDDKEKEKTKEEADNSAHATLAQLARQYENIEATRFLADNGKHVRSVRSSALFDLKALAAHAWPTKDEWRNEETGKLNNFGLVVATVLSTFAYLSPLQFRDMHAVPTDQQADADPVRLSEFHLSALKTSAERLFLSAVPMYEHAFCGLRRVWRWDSKVRSLLWCMSYFAAWYWDALLPAAQMLLIARTICGRKNKDAHRELVAGQEERAQVMNQLHASRWDAVVAEAEQVRNGGSSTASAADALRKYGAVAARIAAKLADGHERVRNMAVWARTPATVRTVVLLCIGLCFSSVCTAHALLQVFGLLFGIVFFFIAPLMERESRLVSWLTLDPVEFMLAGVPNDAQNATLIMRRRSSAVSGGAKEGSSIMATATSTAVAPSHARLAPILRQPSAPLHPKDGFMNDTCWKANEVCFAASYRGHKGMLSLAVDRISFRPAAAATGKQATFNILMERIIGMDKIHGKANAANRSNAPSSGGLKIAVRESANATKLYSLSEMNMRDQAFNRILALAPREWQQVMPPAAAAFST